MQYVSIDIETLGLNPNTCDTIEFGAVLDTVDVDYVPPLERLPRFHCYLTKPNNVYQGEPYAMWMNASILKRIADREEGFSYVPGDLLDEVFAEWLDDHMVYEDALRKPKQKIVVAGKNFQAFDMRFLRRLGFGNRTRIHHRTLDPGSMFFDVKKDKVPPGLADCLERAGITKEVSHNAVEDAIDVIRCIRYRILDNDSS